MAPFDYISCYFWFTLGQGSSPKRALQCWQNVIESHLPASGLRKKKYLYIKKRDYLTQIFTRMRCKKVAVQSFIERNDRYVCIFF